MQDVSEGIVLSARAKGEGAYLVTLFTLHFGLMKGFLKLSSKKKYVIQTGNIVEISRFRRLESQLGTLKLDVLHTPSALCLGDFKRIQVMNYLSEVLSRSLHEEELHKSLYRATKDLLLTLHEKGLWERVGFYELQLLAELGYGLSLTKELAVQNEDDTPLTYVSPKSGRAVSESAGRPYKDKLLRFPAVFGGESEDFLDVFRLTGHFLSQALPEMRFKERVELIDLGIESDFKDI